MSINIKKYGTLRANPLAQLENFNREPKDYSLAYGTDTFSGAMVAARSVKGIKYSEVGAGATIILFPTAVTSANVDAELASAIYNLIKTYEYDVNIVATWAADVLDIVHKGQSTLPKLVLDDDSELTLART